MSADNTDRIMDDLAATLERHDDGDLADQFLNSDKFLVVYPSDEYEAFKRHIIRVESILGVPPEYFSNDLIRHPDAGPGEEV